jgi:hypothetical protein
MAQTVAGLLLCVLVASVAAQEFTLQDPKNPCVMVAFDWMWYNDGGIRKLDSKPICSIY